MSDPAGLLSDLKRLQKALQEVSADIDALERRPHYALHFATDNLVAERSHSIEDVVSNFAIAIQRRINP